MFRNSKIYSLHQPRQLYFFLDYTPAFLKSQRLQIRFFVLPRSFAVSLFKGFGIIAAARKADGSASGQSAGNPEPERTWVPKNEDAKRFLGKPGEIKETFDKNGYRIFIGTKNI